MRRDIFFFRAITKWAYIGGGGEGSLFSERFYRLRFWGTLISSGRGEGLIFEILRCRKLKHFVFEDFKKYVISIPCLSVGHFFCNSYLAYIINLSENVIILFMWKSKIKFTYTVKPILTNTSKIRTPLSENKYTHFCPFGVGTKDVRLHCSYNHKVTSYSLRGDSFWFLRKLLLQCWPHWRLCMFTLNNTSTKLVREQPHHPGMKNMPRRLERTAVGTSP